MPPIKAGAQYLTEFGGAVYDQANMFYNDRLYFTCPTSAVSGERGGVGGPPIANPNVICQDTGVWAFGSLECAGECKGAFTRDEIQPDIFTLKMARYSV